VPIHKQCNRSSLAASIAAHNEFIELATHRPDGVVLPSPIPPLTPRQRIEARLYAIEHFERRMRDLLANPIPEVPNAG